MGAGQSAKFSQGLRHSKRRQQVAAVCYRIRKRGIEFLLVQTHGGRWIFPKGGVEPGLTLAQSAALEAFEEAGVHGRMEEIPFARYFRRRAGAIADALESETPLAVAAHLCQVSRLEPPQESNRNPTWFSAANAKQRLLEDRTREFGAELARVVDRAVSRIERLCSGHQTPYRAPADALRRVRLEAEGRRLCNFGAVVLSGDSVQRKRESAAIEFAAQAHWREFHQMGPSAEIQRPVPRLGAGADLVGESTQKVTAIDDSRSTELAKVVKARRARIKTLVRS